MNHSLLLLSAFSIALSAHTSVHAGSPPSTAPASQPASPPASAPAPRPASPPRLTRADLAEAYLDVERALRAHPPGENAAEINRLFDEATLKFFSGQPAAQTLRELADRLCFGDEVTPNRAFASSLKVSLVPPVLSLAQPSPILVNVSPMYDAPAVGAVAVRVQSPTGKVVFESTCTGPADFSLSPSKFGVGVYRVQLYCADEVRYTARLIVTERSLNATRDELLKSLDAAEAALEPARRAPVAQALAACRARASLLSDAPSPQNPTEFLADPISLREEVERETALIAKGQDPYINRRGDYWRTLSFQGVEVPCRILAPTSGDGPFPLVFTLHGAGGDENMWPDGYGAGELKTLVERHRFIAISPRTELLIGNAVLFESLIDSAASLYPIDRARVYLIGHSLGAMASTSLGTQRPARIAALCLIAGMGRFSANAKLPPTLVLSGEIDPLMRAEQVEAGVNDARRAGQNVELRMIKGRGHTLLVGEQMPEAFAWLLKHKSVAEHAREVK